MLRHIATHTHTPITRRSAGTLMQLGQSSFPTRSRANSSSSSSPAAGTGAGTANGVLRLARLPVPDLHQTLQRYLTSIEPFLLEDEVRGGPSFESAYALRRKWAEEFENGLGRICQDRLLALDKASPNNWLDDNIWLKKAYLEWRAPVIVHSNWWLSFKNDENVPREVLLGRAHGQEIDGIGLSYWQVRRATSLVHRVLDFKAQLERQEVYPDSTKTGIWFRTSTAKIFNVSRIPKPSCDALTTPPPSSEAAARTLLVSVHDWLYAIEVIDEQLNIIPMRELERRLLGVVKDVARRIHEGQAAVPVSVLTTDHRDRWAENLRHLLSLSPRNHETFRAINESVFSLSLDHYTYTLPSKVPHLSSEVPPPDSPEEIDAHLHNLRSARSSRPGHNRWYDKPLTFIVESNTRAGALGEHSPVDALVPSIVAEYAVVESVDHGMFSGALGSVQPSSVGWRRLDWVTDERVEKECKDAEERAREIVLDSDDSVLWFEEYGADWIKEIAKLSPDAYIQMAMQLAWYRTRGDFTATYETTLTRLFRNGRTETIRTYSRDTRAFVLAMSDPSISAQTQFNLLNRAILTHTGLTRAAATGKGIDRHLLGLECMIQPGEAKHPLLSDMFFQKSHTWKLSTSGLSAGHQFRGTGFGASEFDGYGINYLAGPDIIKFGIESKHSSPLTSTQGFKAAIHTALTDMKSICLQNVKAHL